MAVFDFSYLTMPPHTGIVRDIPSRVKVTNQRFLDAYDRSTVFYDCLYDPQERAVVVLAPKLMNLERWVRSLSFFLDGAAAVDWTIRRHRKFDRLVIRSDRLPAVLELVDGPWRTALAVQRQALDHFRNSRVLCTMNKNNRLQWITDWVAFHHAHHGADAVLIFDNGSNDYTVQELDAALAEVPGLRRHGVVSVPLPYGPTRGAASGLGRAKYLQASMLNHARTRFLGAASAVLSIDIDELVISVKGRSVFDAAISARLGMVSFAGHWRYAPSIEQALHRDHVWINDADEVCPSKYCYRPDSVLGRAMLGVHGLEKVSWRWFPRSSDFSFMHCRSISTKWKTMRGNPKAELRRDAVLDRLLT